MMAQAVPHQSTDKRRVKVYELRDSDWHDRGTGFCTAFLTPASAVNRSEARLLVESEEQPNLILLETRIWKEDGFQKQQDTLIVWTEPLSGLDMALSFQEADGCAIIWKFIHNVQQSLANNGAGTGDDTTSDDLPLELTPTFTLPSAELGSLAEIEHVMRIMSSQPSGRDVLAKAIMNEDYVSKLILLVDMAEDLESIGDLHHLCTIMKTIILLNDTGIIEQAVSDECVFGVVGALEYDPDFPEHKANHRLWLNTQGRHKEVVRIEDDQVKRKIHQTYRLQYLKDVVLARILDDATFSVLNSLIFFNQVEIVQHLQSNPGFLRELFSIFLPDQQASQTRKKEGVIFIQQCCAIAKNLQLPARQTLYNNFLNHGLLQVINYGLLNYEVSVRVGATDVLVSMIDHDPQMIRHTVYRQAAEKHEPLTDTLIKLLLVEVDLGIKSQVSDVLKVLLDPSPPPAPPMSQQQEARQNGNGANGEPQQGPPQRPRPPPLDPQQEVYLSHFYANSAARLFQPLLDLEGQTELRFAPEKDGIFSYLNEIMCFYIRQHQVRMKAFVLEQNIANRFMQLITCKHKHLQLVAVRYFRHLVALQDEFYTKHMVEKKALGPILDVLLRTLPRDNLLSSACLELFEFIQNQNIKDLTRHLLECYPEKVTALKHISTFRSLQRLYDEMRGYNANMETFFEPETEATRLAPQGRMRMMDGMSMDPTEEEYWNTSDDEDDLKVMASLDAGNISRPLVDYVSDEDGEDDAGDEALTPPHSANGDRSGTKTPPDRDRESWRPALRKIRLSQGTAPERLSEKRRREEEEDEDVLGKLSHHKRRHSAVERPVTPLSHNSPQVRKSKRSGIVLQSNGTSTNGGGGPRKISITLPSSPKTAGKKGLDESADGST